MQSRSTRPPAAIAGAISLAAGVVGCTLNTEPPPPAATQYDSVAPGADPLRRSTSIVVPPAPKVPGDLAGGADTGPETVAEESATGAVTSIPVERFCPTSGRVAPRGPFAMTVNMGGMRGVVAGDKSATAEIAFTYRGPSDVTTPLADGTIRRQIGLRLRAQDTCNAIYVMWHVAPTPRVAVSVKRNPGMSTHAQCLDRGYINLRPTRENPPSPIETGTSRTLRAEIDGSTLRVSADGVTVWQGALPPEADEIVGPAGIRSDNGAFDFELRVPDGKRGLLGCADVVRD